MTKLDEMDLCFQLSVVYPGRAQSVRAGGACALRALGLLLAGGALTVGRGNFSDGPDGPTKFQKRKCSPPWCWQAT